MTGLAWMTANMRSFMCERHLIILYEYMKMYATGKRDITNEDLKEKLLPNWEAGQYNYGDRYWSAPRERSIEALRAHTCSSHDTLDGNEGDIEKLHERGYLAIRDSMTPLPKTYLIDCNWKTVLLFSDVFPELLKKTQK